VAVGVTVLVAAAQQIAYDVAIRGGHIVDSSGNPWFDGDVAIKNGWIAGVGRLPAQILGLRDRGQLREGFAADVAMFDPATVGETNSFEKPKSYAKGVAYVLVNGVVVIDPGNHTGAKPGKAILGPGSRAAATTRSSR
jgi:N-acyl-D-aspartate/D-glutamate deacylase